MKAGEFVPIIRHFRKIDGVIQQTPRWLRVPSPKLGWQELLAPAEPSRSPVVLVAPSGSGKTIETKELVKNAAHKAMPYFWMEAGHAAKSGVSNALATQQQDFPGQQQRFEEWCHTTAA